jgi:diaminobutyrate-2-oxoglutarate transaminase
MPTTKATESGVNVYARMFPATFVRSKGSEMFSTDGRRFIDFFAGAGALNLGHNHDAVQQAVVDYIKNDGIIHALDMDTEPKERVLRCLKNVVFVPRGLDYTVQFCSPSGANAVEAALKLARKVTRRRTVIAFTGSYHGVSLGALSVTSQDDKRRASGTSLGDVKFFPFADGFCPELPSLSLLEAFLKDPHSGMEVPAAVIVETVQIEGGIYVAPPEWLAQLREICTRFGIILICDDIQAGCGRTGHFFSFEHTGLNPDLVLLSKSVSGFGSPLSLVLIRPKLDVWNSGEHNGTFRGYQVALVGAASALPLLAADDLLRRVTEKGEVLRQALTACSSPKATVRGKGMIWGVDFHLAQPTGLATEIASRCFEDGLILETVGRFASVIKISPPLTIPDEILQEGLAILARAINR